MKENTAINTTARIANAFFVVVLVYALYVTMKLPSLELISYALVSLAAIQYLARQLGKSFVKALYGRDV